MSPLVTSERPQIGVVQFTRSLVVELRSATGEILAREPLRRTHLSELCGELWMQELLRRGRRDVPLEAVGLAATPQLRSDGEVEGFLLRMTAPGGFEIERRYDLDLARDVATTLVHNAIAAEQLKTGDTYTWHIRADRTTGASRDGAATAAPFAMSVTTAALDCAEAPLAPLLQRAEKVGPHDDRDVLVFFVRSAWQRGEDLARKGAERTPAVETGALYVGLIVACPETQDVYIVVTDALELHDAEQAEFSLTLTGPTWTRIRTVVQARRKQPRFRALRILGQTHGHNWLPAGGAPPCEHCAVAEVCTRTTVFVSDDDRRFMRSTMAGQPWQLCLISGFNARKERVSELYGLRDGRLAPRGYYLIDDFAAS